MNRKQFLWFLIICIFVVNILTDYFCLVFSSPHTGDVIGLNCKALRNTYLYKIIWVIISIIIILLIPFKKFRNVLFPTFAVLIIGFFTYILFVNFYDRYQLIKFFNGYKESKIIFYSDDNSWNYNPNETVSFSLSDKLFRKNLIDVNKQELEKESQIYTNIVKEKYQFSRFGNGDSARLFILDTENNKKIFVFDKMAIWGIREIRWSPDLRFIVFDYAYDRDDLSKIFVADIKTGKTILLSAGSNPYWVK